MPKFRVLKGHDAWVVYEAIIEADCAEHAEEFAYADRHASEIWTATGDIREFDHCEVFENEIELVEDDETVEEIKTIAVTGPQRDLILAALRLWQHTAIIPEEIHDIAVNDRGRTLLGSEIDNLCEAINQ
ncbi:hypothetical protein [Mesorhizobium sp.]|uniref:hypothetical protein n=1 Tax=Mesorhizobium sp. TaxID=1871066 RepID=UPI000FE6F0BD|nr:hypothetical protein [Mesorhizobium sp.]RWI35507.1 MAG: hypothetical protein EOR14_28810 [Mesorhizobium sp.]RWJ66324.1 MAG: hypothetical protein EOR34_28325 [Mesorhizobium sp.]